MSLCVAFSIMPLSVSAEAETAAPAVKQNNLWVSTGKTLVFGCGVKYKKGNK